MPLRQLTPEEVADIERRIQQYELGGLTAQAQQLRAMLEAYQTGNAQEVQQVAAQSPFIELRPDQEKSIDTAIAQQNTADERVWQENQASTNLLKAGAQLEQLGLSPSGVLQTGGSNVQGVGAASNPMTNLSQNREIVKYQQRMALAKQLLSMTSSMASAGVYGSALGAAKKVSSVLTSVAAHSGLSALGQVGRKGSSATFNRPSGNLSNGNEPGLSADEEWWT